MNDYVDIKIRLENWGHVYPCDLDKPDGSLYLEALERIKELEEMLRTKETSCSENV